MPDGRIDCRTTACEAYTLPTKLPSKVTEVSFVTETKVHLTIPHCNLLSVLILKYDKKLITDDILFSKCGLILQQVVFSLINRLLMVGKITIVLSANALRLFLMA